MSETYRRSSVLSSLPGGATHLQSVWMARNDAVDALVDRSALDILESKIESLRRSQDPDRVRLADSLSDERSSKRGEGLTVCRTEFVNTQLRVELAECYGRAVTDKLYDFMYRSDAGRKERERLAIGLYKLSRFKGTQKFIAGLSMHGLDRFLELVSSLASSKSLLPDADTIRLYQNENKFARDNASLLEKIVTAIVPDAKDGMASLMKGTMEFLKDKMNLQGASGVSTDEVCLDIFASPVGAVAMLCVACLTGGAGLVVAMLPFYITWSALGGAKSITDELEGEANIHSVLERTSPKLFTVADRDFEKNSNIRSCLTNTTATSHCKEIRAVSRGS